MTWVRFDDRTPSHPKVVTLSDAAFRLWVTATCHASEHLTDGALAAKVVPMLPRVPSGAKFKALVSELEEAGLWHRTDSGWEIHDYLQWNPSGEQVRAKREARAKAGANGGKASGQQRRSKTEVTNEAIASGLVEPRFDIGEAKPNPVPVPVPVVTDVTTTPDPQGAAVAAATESGRIPKPSASPLSTVDVAGLEVDCMGMPRAFAELAVSDWLREPADPKDLRFPHQWTTHALKLVRGTWRDNRRRRELLSAVAGIQLDGPPPESVMTP